MHCGPWAQVYCKVDSISKWLKYNRQGFIGVGGWPD